MFLASFLSKTIIPEAQEHFLTPPATRHTHPLGGLGVNLPGWLDIYLFDVRWAIDQILDKFVGLDEGRDQAYEVAHPTIPESTLNYDANTEVPDWVPDSYWTMEPDCSPHLFDVMAIYALYQNVADSD